MEFWNNKGMNRHDIPDDSVLTRCGIELPLYSAAECGDSDFCRVTLGKIWLSSYSGISWSLLGSLWKWTAGYKRDFQSAIAPPTLTAGQLLGSSRLITKLRTYAERVSRAGLISFFGQLWMWSQHCENLGWVRKQRDNTVHLWHLFKPVCLPPSLFFFFKFLTKVKTSENVGPDDIYR